MKNLVAIIALLGIVFTVEANCRTRVVVQHQAVVHHAAVVQQVVAPIAVAAYVPVQVPVYSVSYGSHASDERLASLEKKFDALVEALKAPQQPQQPTPQNPTMPKAEGGKGLSLLQTHCAACHDATIARAKGADFAIFSSGAMVKLSSKEIVKVLAEIRTNRMPKGTTKLTDEEYSHVAEYLESIALKE
jgi:mono/diheme cytochrome c family protein